MSISRAIRAISPLGMKPEDKVKRYNMVEYNAKSVAIRGYGFLLEVYEYRRGKVG